jgi:hypothetical protein
MRKLSQSHSAVLKSARQEAEHAVRAHRPVEVDVAQRFEVGALVLGRRVVDIVAGQAAPPDARHSRAKATRPHSRFARGAARGA